jgi:hypothetical protein
MMPSALELAKLLGSYFSGRLRQRAEQLTEPKRLRFQRIHDHRFPFTVDYVGGDSHWALRKLHILGSPQATKKCVLDDDLPMTTIISQKLEATNLETHRNGVSAPQWLFPQTRSMVTPIFHEEAVQFRWAELQTSDAQLESMALNPILEKYVKPIADAREVRCCRGTSSEAFFAFQHEHTVANPTAADCDPCSIAPWRHLDFWSCSGKLFTKTVVCTRFIARSLANSI